MTFKSPIRFLGRDIEIIRVPAHQLDASYGLYSAEHKAILYREGQAPVEETDTVIHEVLHMIFDLMNLRSAAGIDEEQEERIVRPLATGLTAVIVANPQFAARLAHIPKKGKQ